MANGIPENQLLASNNRGWHVFKLTDGYFQLCNP